MAQTIEALFDGKVFKPKKRPNIEPNTVCNLTIEPREEEPHPTMRGPISPHCRER